MDEQRLDWHRLFGGFLSDLFTGQPMTVEQEVDLSLKQQFLDVVLLRKGSQSLTVQLPDGFEDLAPYNLISFKSHHTHARKDCPVRSVDSRDFAGILDRGSDSISERVHQETLNVWTLEELVGHYVNYCKQVSPDLDHLLPVTDFRLFAVTVRYPHDMAQQLTLRPIRPGVYAVNSFTQVIRLIVVHQLPQEDQNALMHLFSAKTQAIRFGKQRYQVKSKEASTLLAQLLERDRVEGLDMPLDVERYMQDLEVGLFKIMPAERWSKILQELSPADRQKFIQGMTLEQRQEVLNNLPPDEVIKSLPPQVLEALRRRFAAGDREDGSP